MANLNRTHLTPQRQKVGQNRAFDCQRLRSPHERSRSNMRWTASKWMDGLSPQQTLSPTRYPPQITLRPWFLVIPDARALVPMTRNRLSSTGSLLFFLLLPISLRYSDELRAIWGQMIFFLFKKISFKQ